MHSSRSTVAGEQVYLAAGLDRGQGATHMEDLAYLRWGDVVTDGPHARAVQGRGAEQDAENRVYRTIILDAFDLEGDARRRARRTRGEGSGANGMRWSSRWWEV